MTNGTQPNSVSGSQTADGETEKAELRKKLLKMIVREESLRREKPR